MPSSRPEREETAYARSRPQGEGSAVAFGTHYRERGAPAPSTPNCSSLLPEEYVAHLPAEVFMTYMLIVECGRLTRPTSPRCLALCSFLSRCLFNLSCCQHESFSYAPKSCFPPRPTCKWPPPAPCLPRPADPVWGSQKDLPAPPSPAHGWSACTMGPAESLSSVAIRPARPAVYVPGPTYPTSLMRTSYTGISPVLELRARAIADSIGVHILPFRSGEGGLSRAYSRTTPSP